MKIEIYGRIIAITAMLGCSVFADEFPPKPACITSFSNNPQFQYSSGDIYQKLSKDKFLEFLKKGEIIPVKVWPNDSRLHGRVTFRDSLSPRQRNQIKFELSAGQTGESLLRCQGVAVTQNRIYFWELKNDQVLWISDGQQAECFLRIELEP